MFKFLPAIAFVFSLITSKADAQTKNLTCENSAIPQIDSNGTTTACTCPPGFGGETCSFPGCGDDIFYGNRRNVSQPQPLPLPPNSTALKLHSNLTASRCNCASGWTGTGCNVCASDWACQNAFDISGTQPYQQMGCNAQPYVLASGMASCQIQVSSEIS